ncbi:cellulase family glycosylhydrolase [Aminobacter anthyllidis]|uniref:glycoside hydrolase family 5 protein n=1 Tax=Aminobacter anthyllidis TaxID=1035067 RepID=UPI0024543999|nr:cellulase family glycosylhydrolase [Aminobacter anthyllidis]MDH4987614.1 cellulase family glycosylhydrolase [Aminobacter anthyllidis]
MIRTSLMALLALALSVCSAGAATFSMKRGVNLDIWETWPGEDKWGDANVILPFPEWRKRLGEDELKALKAGGFDVVRIPVDPSVFLSEKTEPLREQLLESVLESARMVNAAGLKVVVDLHLIPAGGNGQIGMSEVMDDPANFDRYVELVRQMGLTLAKEDPAQVAFELMNEPVVDCEPADAKVWPERLKRLYAAARSSATRLTLVLSGSCWASAEGLAALDPKDIPDDNVIWTFHSYQPFLLTTQGATWAGDFIRYVTGLPYPPYSVPRQELDAALDKVRAKIRAEAPLLRRSGMLAYLDEQMALVDSKEKLEAELDAPFAQVDAWAKKHGISPDNIYLGEFGMIRQEYNNPYVMPGAWRAAYVSDMIARAEAHGFAWSIWGYGGAFGIVDEFEGRKAESDVLEVVKGLK